MAPPRSLLALLGPALALVAPAYAAIITPLHRRATAIPNPLPGSWTSKGCYTDQAAGVRALAAATYTSTTAMTIENCLSFCTAQNAAYVYAGVEYAQECWCDSAIRGTNAAAPAADCSSPCTGNANEPCGAGNRLNVFFNPAGPAPPQTPVAVPTVGTWTSLGCYTDSVNARSLPNAVGTNGAVSAQTCTAACAGLNYKFAGMEYSTECYCGNALASTATAAAAGDCNMPCAGNATQACGAGNRLSVYTNSATGGGSTTPPPSSTPPPTSTPPTSTAPPPTSTPGGGGGTSVGLPAGWAYRACYVDNAHGRVFVSQLEDDPKMTVGSCATKCKAAGWGVAGMEYSTQCFCGNQLVNGATVATDGGCNMPCGGDATQSCGGPNRLSVYSAAAPITVLPVPTTKTTDLPGNWKYQGCLKEPGARRVLPYQNAWPANNTVDGCLNRCAAFGYPAAGLEYGQECWCGDVADVTGNGGVLGAEADCAMPCSGDGVHICGGPERLTLYYWTGGTPLYTWNTPANKGSYQFLIGGVVIPLVATVGVNNKVTFLEKSGTSPYANSTGAYELDLSQLNDASKAWRTMHVQSDVFCSASLVLPDKGARQINIGGWSLDSTKGIRLYTPDGSAGVPGKNDWQENFQAIHLQRQRWYPSAVVLNNGSILVVGGELGSNDKPEPSLEILPTPPGGPTYLNMEWLQRTDPNNLYPFLFILPSQRVFVAYYNEARILDQNTFATIKQLPNMPGNVNNFLAGRTYPMEGAAVMLPQYPPYTAPVEILVCGGSTTIPTGGVGLDNCLRTAPEAANPTWLLERMPSKRVMPCMAALPDGTFLILNGARQGNAGFGLANDPNLGAVLYNPAAPVGSRFSILANTIVARLYHSEATLLPDGRVLVSGSDPNPDGVQVFPEEFRLEVYVPPYLSAGLKQPEFTLGTKNWAYGGSYQITNVKLYQGATAGLKVSLIAATSSTHGAIMGGRTLFPAVSCSGTTCTITAPPAGGVCPAGWFMLFVLDGPTPSVAQWVQIGGDPGKLGNWPATGGFTVPGV